MSENINKKIQNVLNSLLLSSKYRFVHYFLFKCSIKEDNNIPTACIYAKKGRITIAYNTSFFSKLEEEEVQYIFIHEILHLLFRHIFKKPSPVYYEIDNIASDLAVNTLIDIKPPEGVLLPENFGFPPKLSYEKYLLYLRDYYKDKKVIKNKAKAKNGDGNSEGSIDFHGKWSDDPLSQQVVEELLDAAKKSEIWGNIPQEIIEEIESSKRKNIKWNKILHFYLNGIIKHNIRYTIKKMNRRYSFIYPGKINEYTGKVLLGIDTSASIEKEDLSIFLSEINKLNEYYCVYYTQFDTEIKGEPLKWKTTRTFKFIGRGGTSYQPLMNYVEDKKIPYLIILTDGYAPSVNKPKTLKECYWVITKKGKPPVNWGKVIEIK